MLSKLLYRYHLRRKQRQLETIQQELSALFPDVEVARMDADTVSASNPHEVILDRFRRGEQKILQASIDNILVSDELPHDLSCFSKSKAKRACARDLDVGLFLGR